MATQQVSPAVVDAAALLEYLLGTPFGYEVGSVIEEPAAALYVPELCDVEIGDGIRAMIGDGALDPSLVEQTIVDYLDLPITVQSHRPLIVRIFEIGDAYIALAEALNATLITGDASRTRAAQRASLNVVGVS